MDESSIYIAAHQDRHCVSAMNDLIDLKFKKTDQHYFDWGVEEFRELATATQELLNQRNMMGEILKQIKENLYNYLGSSKVLVQSNLYLRCSRPKNPDKQESIGFHRESFYGENMEKSVNVWTPIKGVTSENTLRYVPKSQNIAAADIIIEHEDDEYTDQFSDGHKLGFLYRPKKIIGGVDLESSQPMTVKKFSSAFFSGNLIHGAAVNRSSHIRFSVDFRIIRECDYSCSNKEFHFSSGKPYFIKMKDVIG
jgi:hypothetical protein